MKQGDSAYDIYFITWATHFMVWKAYHIRLKGTCDYACFNSTKCNGKNWIQLFYLQEEYGLISQIYGNMCM